MSTKRCGHINDETVCLSCASDAQAFLTAKLKNTKEERDVFKEQFERLGDRYDRKEADLVARLAEAQRDLLECQVASTRRLMDELEKNRDLRARLEAAEERMRFAERQRAEIAAGEEKAIRERDEAREALRRVADNLSTYRQYDNDGDVVDRFSCDWCGGWTEDCPAYCPNAAARACLSAKSKPKQCSCTCDWMNTGYPSRAPDCPEHGEKARAALQPQGGEAGPSGAERARAYGVPPHHRPRGDGTTAGSAPSPAPSGGVALGWTCLCGGGHTDGDNCPTGHAGKPAPPARAEVERVCGACNGHGCSSCPIDAKRRR